MTGRAQPRSVARRKRQCTESNDPKITERMNSDAWQGARPRRTEWHREAEQRSVAPDFAANYQANF